MACELCGSHGGICNERWSVSNPFYVHLTPDFNKFMNVPCHMMKSFDKNTGNRLSSRDIQRVGAKALLIVASSSLMYWRSPLTPLIRVYSWARRPPSLPMTDFIVATEAPTISPIVVPLLFPAD